MNNVNSLSYQVMKGKYFHELDPWKIEAHENISFLWRSLLEGRKIALAGGIWRVGNGKNIDAWNDNWVP